MYNLISKQHEEENDNESSEAISLSMKSPREEKYD